MKRMCYHYCFLEKESITLLIFSHYLVIILPTKTLLEKRPEMIVDRRCFYVKLNVALNIRTIKKQLSETTIKLILEWALTKSPYIQGITRDEFEKFYKKKK